MKDMNRFKRAWPAAATIASIVGAAAPAYAHISLDMTGEYKSRYEDGGQTKVKPCGTPLGPARKNVYTFQPGETIQLSVVEFVPHPSYFRIAFDDEGDDDFVDPRWIAPPLPANRACPMNANDQCRPDGEGDFFNNDTVLMDNLNEHQAGGNQTYTWDVTLPDVECDNCTLQIIQVMKDPALGFHGDYNTTDNDDANDVYHQCIDIVLKRSAPDMGTDNPPANMQTNPMTNPPMPAAMTGGPMTMPPANVGTTPPAPVGTPVPAAGTPVPPAQPSTPPPGTVTPMATTTPAPQTTVMMPVAGNSALPPQGMIAAPAKSDDSGGLCAVGTGSRSNATGTLLVAVGLLWLTRRRQRA